ncbi:MAG: bspRIM [Candidatus Adlerbacteria bacterium]|nr:bspRIM [Candidatus Adlerbacteria bacterium]
MFSGCGGSDLGLVGGFHFLGKEYKKLPYEIVFALDNDAKAVDTYNRNFDVPATLADIEDFDIKKIPDFDVLMGGFPCQSFSTVNPTKNPFDKRGKLYKRMSKILDEKKPKYFIAENVKGLVMLQGGKIFDEVIKDFAAQGYVVKYKVFNAADYGVPQKRERVFIIGIRKDVAFNFQFPEPTNSQFGTDNNKWIGLKNVIDSLKPKDPKYYFSKKAVEGMKKAKKNMKRGLAQDLENPCLTITSHLAKVSLNSRDPVLLVDKKKELYRRFSPLEAARIQSFPDQFEFLGSDASAYKQIGNAIPPVLMWHIANALQIQAKKENKAYGGHILPKKAKRNNVAYPL